MHIARGNGFGECWDQLPRVSDLRSVTAQRCRQMAARSHRLVLSNTAPTIQPSLLMSEARPEAPPLGRGQRLGPADRRPLHRVACAEKRAKVPHSVTAGVHGPRPGTRSRGGPPRAPENLGGSHLPAAQAPRSCRPPATSLDRRSRNTGQSCLQRHHRRSPPSPRRWLASPAAISMSRRLTGSSAAPGLNLLRRGAGEVRLGFYPSLRAHFSSHGARLQISFLEVNPAVPA
jgi:hypothetical protein